MLTFFIADWVNSHRFLRLLVSDAVADAAVESVDKVDDVDKEFEVEEAEEAVLLRL